MPSAGEKFLYPLSTQPGIQRDGTPLDGNNYVDGQWVRFRKGRPRKMGGYRELINLTSLTVPANVPTAPPRTMFTVPNSGSVLNYAFHNKGITAISTDKEGSGGAAYDLTPTVSFTANDTLLWQADAVYASTGLTTNTLVCHPGNNLVDIASDVATQVFIGNPLDLVTKFAKFGTPQTVSGGVCAVQPCMTIYGSNGLIMISDANKPDTYAGGVALTANVAGTKIVKGLPLRGGANAPAALYWSLDSLIRMTFVGGTKIWQFDTVSDQTTILSSQGVVEVDGVFFWVAVDRFMMYNGVVQEVPNQFNQDFFFDNLNRANAQKVAVIKVPRWGEIWWLFPLYPSTECNWAVVYNYREQCWYDTPITRAGGLSPREYYFPIMSDAQSNSDTGHTGYRIYRHEFQQDAIVGSNVTAIKSYFETSNFGFATGGVTGQGTELMNKATRITKVEPDFEQVGAMTVEVTGQAYAQGAAAVTASANTFLPGSSTTTDDNGRQGMDQQRRLLRLKFTSDVQGGFYHMGKVLTHLEPGDEM